MTIYLYSAVTSDKWMTPNKRTYYQKAKNKAVRKFEALQWNILNSTSAHYSTHEDYLYSNVGDMAINLCVKTQLKNCFPDYEIIFREIRWSDLDWALVNEINRYGDALIITGGGYLHTGTTGRISTLCEHDIVYFRRISAPKIAISIGLNSLLRRNSAYDPSGLDKRSVEILEELEETFDLISVRDKNSKSAFQRNRPSEVTVTCDPALFLNHTKRDLNKRRRLPNDNKRIGINVAFHGGVTSENMHNFLPLFSEALRGIHCRHGAVFTYFIHSDAEHFVSKCLKKNALPIDVFYGDPVALLEQYECLDVHIGQMLHSNIFATNVGVPNISIAYDIKSIEFFASMGMSDCCLNVHEFSSEELNSVLDNAIKNEKPIRERFGIEKAKLQSTYCEFLKRVSSCILGK